MFWGLQLEANLRYSQQVPEGFRITKATLSTESPATEAKAQDPASKLVQVFVEQEGSDYAIATLKHGEIYDCSMDLRFAEGEDICFYLKGDGVVFLTGHNLYPDDASELGLHQNGDDPAGISEDDSDSSEDVPSLYNQDPRRSTLDHPKAPTVMVPTCPSSEDEEEDEDSDDADESSVDESVDEEGSVEDDDEDEEDEDDDEVDEQEEPRKGKVVPGLKRTTAPLSKNSTPEAKKAKLQNGTSMTPRGNGDVKRVSGSAKASQSSQNAAAPQKNDSAKNLVVEDVRVGSGPVAKKGKTVRVYYTGTLLNGKKFDSLVEGKPFQFKLGTSSVIKGWDVGIEGMRVGGKRRLVIPPSMAYGKKKMGPIPPDSTLKFDVELKAVV